MFQWLKRFFSDSIQPQTAGSAVASLLDKAQLLIDSKDLSAAETNYREVLKLDPNNSVARRKLELVLTVQRHENAERACSLQLEGLDLIKKGDHAGAQQKYRQAVALDPSNAEANQKLRLLSEHQYHHDAAHNALRQTVEQTWKLPKEGVILFLTLADPRASRKLAEDAAEALKRLDMNPHDAQAHNSLGLTLMVQGNVREATEAFRQAVKIGPNFHEAHYNLGLALRKGDQATEAISAFSRYIELAAADQNEKEWLANAEVHLSDLRK